MIIARGSAMKTLTRTTITKKRGRLQVNKINCSADSVSPKMGWNGSPEEKSTSRLKNVTVLAFSYPILRVCPRTGELRQGALRRQEGTKGLRSVLATRIRSKDLNGGRELSVNHGCKRPINRQ